MRSWLVAIILVVGCCLFSYLCDAREDDEQFGTVAGLFCQSPSDVKNVVQRIVGNRGGKLADITDRTLQGMNCAFEVDEVKIVGSALAVVGDNAYMIIQFRDAFGHHIYSWERLDGQPA